MPTIQLKEGPSLFKEIKEILTRPSWDAADAETGSFF